MVVQRARAAALLLLALHGFSAFAATLRPRVFSVSNTTSSDAISLPILNNLSNHDGYGDCSNPATSRRGLYPAKQEDCFNAAKELFYVEEPFRAITFARSSNVGFKLPQVARNGTCVISIDVINNTDMDKFEPVLLYIAAWEIVSRCTQGTFRYGGKITTGPKKVVDVLVFGRAWRLDDRAAEPVNSKGVVAAAGEHLTSRDSRLMNEPSFTSSRSSVVNNTSRNDLLRLNAVEARSSLKCYDPPLPRERAWPIDVKDCEIAAYAIIGDRQSDKKYTFSREPIVTEFYYPLPATYRFRSCVVRLDTNDDRDQDTARLSTVEATAWVLAHKCSGEESSVEKYGGLGTVGVGSEGLINVWVYGRLWPPPVGATNVSTLVLARPASLIDSK